MQIDNVETLCLDIPEAVHKNLPNFSISELLPLIFDIKVGNKEHGKGILLQSFAIQKQIKICSKNWHKRNLKEKLCVPILQKMYITRLCSKWVQEKLPKKL